MTPQQLIRMLEERMEDADEEVDECEVRLRGGRELVVVHRLGWMVGTPIVLERGPEQDACSG